MQQLTDYYIQLIEGAKLIFWMYVHALLYWTRLDLLYVQCDDKHIHISMPNCLGRVYFISICFVNKYFSLVCNEHLIIPVIPVLYDQVAWEQSCSCFHTLCNDCVNATELSYFLSIQIRTVIRVTHAVNACRSLGTGQHFSHANKHIMLSGECLVYVLFCSVLIPGSWGFDFYAGLSVCVCSFRPHVCACGNRCVDVWGKAAQRLKLCWRCVCIRACDGECVHACVFMSVDC